MKATLPASNFYKIKVSNWEEARALADSLQNNWVFRGQPNAEWPLKTKLHRESEKYNRHAHEWLYLERWMLREFQRGAHHYINDLPADNEYLDWLARMQHYGAPTRLLDFTHSFYVAAFFAMEARPQTDTKEAAMWALNCNVLHRRANDEFGLSDMRLDDSARIDRVNQFIAENIAERKNKPFLLAVEPRRSDVRLKAQQGLFMFPCEISMSLYDNLAATLGLPRVDVIDVATPVDCSAELIKLCQGDNVDTLKILLPYEVPYQDKRANYSEAYRIMSDLKKMNITPATLFPGLDGFARSMACYLRHYGERPSN